MPTTTDPFHFLLIAVAGWMNQAQQHAFAYLREVLLDGGFADRARHTRISSIIFQSPDS